VELPVEPTYPISSPAATWSPTETAKLFWWQYHISVPSGSVTIVRLP
jgi:hypothetical protein